jgi:hypothetical protein
MRSLEGRIRKLEISLPGENEPVFVLVIGVNERSYCLINGKKVYSGPEFERAKKKWGKSKGPIQVIESKTARGVNEDEL